jgi:acyl carrier protein
MTKQLDAPAVEAMIIDAINALNEDIDGPATIAAGPDTVLFGERAEIDSLSLVSVIVDVETALLNDHGIELALVDDRALSRDASPFTDVQALKAHVLELVRERVSG